ncbi:hypothetical protein QYE76_045022 [Lolium multiflorum]|uniref:Transposase MuDR plant domain-containing protein n=1 Tax=Lolium multiflorum TaxID=4521 RepID=A0AAD8TJR0_LOLMU|nr:hypothetical protein QYE76_045022 [Lolium multiflorum]
MGYVRNESMTVYWCLPDKLLTDGLVSIQTNANAIHMSNVVGPNCHTLYVYLDHTNFLKHIRPRLIVRLDGNADDGNAEEGNAEEGNSEEGNAEEGNAEAGNSEEGNVANGNAPNGNSYEGNSDILDDSDGSVDSDFMSNDYDAADGDHDLFINNVDLEVHDNNEHQNVDEIENDATLIEDDDLQLTAEVEEHLQNKFKVFNEAVDMTNPEFKMGMKFSDVKELRNALQAYIIRNRVPVHKIRNEPKRIEVVCKEGCTWHIKASADSRYGAFAVKQYTGHHTCEKGFEVRALPSKYLCDTFITEFVDNMRMDLKSFAAKVQREFNMCRNRWKLGRARKKHC